MAVNLCNGLVVDIFVTVTQSPTHFKFLGGEGRGGGTLSVGNPSVPLPLPYGTLILNQGHVDEKYYTELSLCF